MIRNFNQITTSCVKKQEFKEMLGGYFAFLLRDKIRYAWLFHGHHVDSTPKRNVKKQPRIRENEVFPKDFVEETFFSRKRW